LNIEESLSFLQEIKIENKKALRQDAKGLEIVKLPLLDTFRTFKEDIAIENIRLNQLIIHNSDIFKIN